MKPFTFTEFSLMLLAFKLKQSDLAEQIQSAGELDDASYKRMVQINNDFQKALMTPVTIASFDPTYDSESNITEEDINLDSASQTRSYTYDDENQLLTADTPNVDYTYTYDQRNNRLTQQIVSTSPALDTTDYYTYNKEDELTAWERRTTQNQTVLEAYTFVYDELGDCVSQTKTSVTPPEVTAYEYYVGGNLKQVTLPDTTEIEYLYDANSNRIQKTNATEIIDYHYSGSELKSEVHKNKQNTILYTLTYYPYGFEKTVGQTTSSYYYIYDNRGFVWALTDSGGDIVETYDYSPYGELLSTPSITNHLFLSGADQCIYDEETSMVHLNNRYYIPKMGRFLQRDSVEGTPTSTISQNLYTYCQNSPITLIDPSGNSPQNTGTPPRTETVNAAAFSGDLSCYMPDMNKTLTLCDPQTIDKPELPNGGHSIYMQGESPATEFDSCNYVTKLPDGSYVVVSNGVKVYVTETIDSKGKKTLVAKPSSDPNDPNGNYDAEKLVADGLNAGFADIISRGGKLEDFDTLLLLSDVVEFAKTNLSTFTHIYTGSEDPASVFYKHAVVGGAIKQAMSGDPRAGADHGQYDMSIGFWVSFHITEAERLGLDKVSLNSTYGTALDGTDTYLGLVDIARGIRAILYCEHGRANGEWDGVTGGDNFDEGKNGDDFGVMQVNERTFKKGWSPWKGNFYKSPFYRLLRGYEVDNLWQTNTFGNIGVGIGELFTSALNGSKMRFKKLSLFNWEQLAYRYNNRLDGDGRSAYYKCWLRFLKHINPKFNKYNEADPSKIIIW